MEFIDDPGIKAVRIRSAIEADVPALAALHVAARIRIARGDFESDDSVLLRDADFALDTSV